MIPYIQKKKKKKKKNARNAWMDWAWIASFFIIIVIRIINNLRQVELLVLGYDKDTVSVPC